ncbi:MULTISPECIES: MBL fold metallo-hydrolase [unclassified Sphingomonas]|uniref:MBL fold metallo-hydrolase n=1 Tax=unclassified Sphingomonas TaxID=196159 RepID=UPI0016089813|nr:MULTISPECIES: MBL fold metallo-hydrolase [unclassified Sphingomonas]MBB3347387.1 glyoxylase-like metal-dependent hydrolase (beta-lactamase superfamily II) [Sphingomonas sp. BK069]MBB3472182.1 glyoxylase-like metal-dependent hydrolase (beta-lactamase superfamily II) [Sphingomonas sp. BK345]
MRIHHLNCGTCCPAGGALFDGSSAGARAHLVCHCLLIESEAGLVLVDTGYGTRDVARPRQRLAEFFIQLCNPQLRGEETARAQVIARGFDPADVRHIVLTHLDFDHAGGIEDFPNATIHLLSREREVADARAGGAFVGRRRYRPQQWDEAENWRLYAAGGGERWFGFDAVRQLEGLPPELLLVPLAGHSWGHAGVAIQEDDGQWLLHAGDAYFYRGEVGSEDYHCPPGLRGYQKLMEVDRVARLANQRRLRRLSLDHAGEVRMFCAHDAVEFELLAGQESPVF